ncbi:Hypothetical_protein [Hexamita inflata]|uniref:Hypothetical_protein n=1 Tax=Hexamita inflata TaxID=28002 RepID=A0AA86N4L4_9EUKA|nr:Hypothetical protein HINF_LOCUS276 [Hexamita inflata]
MSRPNTIRTRQKGYRAVMYADDLTVLRHAFSPYNTDFLRKIVTVYFPYVSLRNNTEKIDFSVKMLIWSGIYLILDVFMYNINNREINLYHFTLYRLKNGRRIKDLNLTFFKNQQEYNVILYYSMRRIQAEDPNNVYELNEHIEVIKLVSQVI